MQTALAPAHSRVSWWKAGRASLYSPLHAKARQNETSTRSDSQNRYQLLGLAMPLGGERGRGDVEEGGLCLRCARALASMVFPLPGRTIQQEAPALGTVDRLEQVSSQCAGRITISCSACKCSSSNVIMPTETRPTSPCDMKKICTIESFVICGIMALSLSVQVHTCFAPARPAMSFHLMLGRLSRTSPSITSRNRASSFAITPLPAAPVLPADATPAHPTCSPRIQLLLLFMYT